MCAKILKPCLLVFIVLMSGSCSKSSDPKPNGPESYFMRFYVDGVKKEYKMSPRVLFEYHEDQDVNEGEALAGLSSDFSKDVLTFLLHDKEEFQSGKKYDVKNEIKLSESVAFPQLIVVYVGENGNAYTAQFANVAALNIQDEAELFITEITDSFVKGTFSAKVFSHYPEREERLITDGEFMLERIH